MAYILVALVEGHKYFVQLYKGEWRLNGLRDNAAQFVNEETAAEKRLGIKNQFKPSLHIQEILPTNDTNPL